MICGITGNSLAGIVTYNPDIKRLQENIEAVLRNGLQKIVVVDNHSENIEAVMAYLNTVPEAILIRNERNEGIARALNQIFAEADSCGYDWVLTLDQDSVIDDNLMEVFTPYANEEEIASLITLMRDRNIRPQKNRKKFDDTEFVKCCITSGNLVRTKCWKAVGGFNDLLFIDEVDNDFCYRLRERGYKILRINQYCMLHELGRIRIFTILGRKFITFNHSSFRKYYMIRNRVYLVRTQPLAREWDSYYKIIRFIMKSTIFEKHRGQKLVSMLRGFRDGMKMEPARRQQE